MKKDKRFVIVLNSEDHKRIRVLCAEKELTFQDLCTEALNLWFKSKDVGVRLNK